MLDNLPTLSEVVKIHGLSANKKLGQHFLLDMNITHNIAKLATPLDGVSVAEIGPGPGGLTRALLLKGATQVLAIEMDERFLAPLDDIAAQSEGRLSVLHADALKADIATHLAGEIKIAANLPYNVGTKLLINWLTAKPLFWSQAVLMFQKEVAERIIATPQDKAYGRLAILAQSVCHVRMAFEVPARAFSPPPKVDSAVVVLEPLPTGQRYSDLKLLGQITAAAFGQRRKMLRRSLRNFAKTRQIDIEDWFESAGIDPSTRPESLEVHAFQKLADYIRAANEKQP